MTSLLRIATSTGAQTVAGALLALTWALFAGAHLRGFFEQGAWNLLTYAIAETLVAAFFLFRSAPRTVTTKPLEWLVAVSGTFLPLFLRPTFNAVLPGAELGLILGSGILILGVLSLNRSFALVPALRELKTAGMYRVVRHPIYASYVISFWCYLLANFSSANLAIVVCSTGLLILRIFFEERHLQATTEYRAYQASTKWRLIPFLF